MDNIKTYSSKDGHLGTFNKMVGERQIRPTALV